MCGADADYLAMNYQSLERLGAVVLKTVRVSAAISFEAHCVCVCVWAGALGRGYQRLDVEGGGPGAVVLEKHVAEEPPCLRAVDPHQRLLLHRKRHWREWRNTHRNNLKRTLAETLSRDSRERVP